MWDTRSIYLGKVKTPKDASIIESKIDFLDNSKSGQKIKIIELPSGKIKAQLIRLGIADDEEFTVLKRLPGGTVVLGKNRQEIAVGYDLSKKIKIRII